MRAVHPLRTVTQEEEQALQRIVKASRERVDVVKRAKAILAVRAGMRLEVVKLPEAKRGFVLLPRSFVVERSFAWMTRVRRLARDYERLPETLAGLHLLAFIVLMLHRFAFLMAHCP